RLDAPQPDGSAVVERFLAEGGCGLLLDVSHAWLSAHYAGRSAREFVQTLPLGRVVELHVAGIEPDPDLAGPWIGTAVPTPELLDLAVFAAERAPGLRAVTFAASSSPMTAPT